MERTLRKPLLLQGPVIKILTTSHPPSMTAWKTNTRTPKYNVSGFVEELPQLPKRRYYHACAALPSTKAFIVAGGHDGSNFLSSVLTLLPGAQAWTPLASLSLSHLPRSLISARASIVGANMRVTGGWDGSSYRSEVLEYQPEPMNNWNVVGQLEATREHHGVLSIDPELLPCLKGVSETTTSPSTETKTTTAPDQGQSTEDGVTGK